MPVPHVRAAVLGRLHGQEAGYRVLGPLGSLRALASSRQPIVEEPMLKAAETSASFDSLAKLLGISRRTLYRWQETVGVKQDPEGD